MSNNGMKYYRQSFKFPNKRLYLNSRNANYVTSRGDMIFQLNQPIVLPEDVIAYVSINDFIIPNTEYNVNLRNNTLWYLNCDDHDYLVDIEAGNYTAVTLQTALQAEFDAFGGSANEKLTVTYKKLNNLYTFTNASTGVNASFVFNNDNDSIR